jgi:hypothetical protein
VLLWVVRIDSVVKLALVALVVGEVVFAVAAAVVAVVAAWTAANLQHQVRLPLQEPHCTQAAPPACLLWRYCSALTQTSCRKLLCFSIWYGNVIDADSGPRCARALIGWPVGPEIWSLNR